MNLNNESLIILNGSDFDDNLRKIIQEELASIMLILKRPTKTLTRNEAAKKLNVCPNTISEWVKIGRLKNRGIGRKILLMESDLDGLQPRNYTQYKKQ
jgi:excisionase family DNA binding protein